MPATSTTRSKPQELEIASIRAAAAVHERDGGGHAFIRAPHDGKRPRKCVIIII